MINLIAMDVYNSTPTIVTMWLTIIPKVSILILLLELYIQIDWFENDSYAFFPIINEYILDFSALPEIVSDFFQIFGGVDNYEAYRLAHPNINNIPADQIFESAKYTLMSINTQDIINAYNLDPFDKHWDYWLNLKVVLGGSSVALPDLLFISSLLSLIIGTVLGLAQTQIKRLLAWNI